MDQIHAVAYVSTAVDRPSDAQVEGLLQSARTFNESVGVTGALLLNELTFFQYFEGPVAGVEEVYARIQRSPLHRHIVELLRGPIPAALFSHWYMGFARAPASVMLQLEHARWQGAAAIQQEQDRRRSSEGLDLLLMFWQSAPRAA